MLRPGPFLLALLFVLTGASVARAQFKTDWQPSSPVREYFDGRIPSAGYTGFDASGPYILYNPTIWEQTPLSVRSYTRAHEHGHVFCITSNGDWSELCADRWAGARLAEAVTAVLDDIISFYESPVACISRFSPNHLSGCELALLFRVSKPINIRARDFAKGTKVQVATDDAATKHYGADVVTNAPDYNVGGNVLEYKINAPADGLYVLWVEYASAEPRPVEIYFNGWKLTAHGLAEVTGGWLPTHQKLLKQSPLHLRAGANTLRLQTAGSIPHIRTIRLASPY